MSRTNQCLIFFLAILLSVIASADEVNETFNGTWSGIEVMGVDQNVAKEIRNLAPIKLNTPFSSSEFKKLKSWCNEIKDNISAKEVNCAFIGYPGAKFYFDVEVVPMGAKEKKFRTIPEKHTNDTKLPQRMEDLVERFNKRLFHLISIDKYPIETETNGYPDYV